MPLASFRGENPDAEYERVDFMVLPTKAGKVKVAALDNRCIAPSPLTKMIGDP
jgi:hypothetical protein